MTTRDIVVAGALPRQQFATHNVYERPNEQHPWNSVNLGACSCPAEQDHYTDETPEALEWVRKVTG